MESTLGEADDIFRRSLDNFRAQLNLNQCETFEATSLADLKRDILSMQKEQEHLRRLQDPSRLFPFIEVFEDFNQVCQAVSIGVDGIAAFTWGPLKWILHRAKEDDKVQDAIFDKCFELGKHVPSLQPYIATIKKTPPMRRCLAFMYADLLDFYASTINLFRERNWKYTFQPAMRDYKASFEMLRNRFSSQGDQVKSWLTNEEMRLSQATNRQVNSHSQQLHEHIVNTEGYYNNIAAFIQQYDKDRETLIRNAEEQEKRRKEEMYTDVLGWIKAPWDLQSQYHSQWAELRDSFPGTGQWILNTDKLLEWMSPDTPPQSLLWMNGKMGQGKTILASQIIDKCLEMEGFVTSYFYCRGENVTQNTTLAFYKCLLRQLISHHRHLLPSCDEKRKRGDLLLNDPLTAKSLIELFCDVQLNQFIIVDGLDECEVDTELRSILGFLKDIVDRCDSYKPGKIRVLLVSRDVPLIRRSMQSGGIMDLTTSNTNKDIELFVAMKMQELMDKFKLSERDARTVNATICAQAHGSFLFASLVVDNLIKQPNIATLMSEIHPDNLPEDLEKAYDKIINRLRRDLSRNQWEEARKIFGWLACAKRPLKLHELQAARVVQRTGEYDEQRMDVYDWILRDDIRTICGSLVHQFPSSRIEFIHSTTQTYIMKNQNLDEKALELDLTITCLQYLSLPCFRGSLNDEDRTKYAREGYYAFQDYAVSRWAHHVETLIEKGPSLYDHTEIGMDCRQRLSVALSRFIDLYRAGLLAEPERPDGAGPSQSQQQSTGTGTSTGDEPATFCAAFEGQYAFYSDLVLVWSHIYKHQQAGFRSRNKVSIKELSESFLKIRKVLENLKPGKSASTSGAASPSMSIVDLYGSNLVKCDRLTCDYFYEGFESQAVLNKHLARHDRPFLCPVQGCTMVKFGFSSNKDRDRHINAYHPDESGQPAGFAQIGRRVVEETEHHCEICGKNFTRAANLSAHKDNHFGVRRFECSTCGRAFTRANDRTRHQNTVHVRRPRGR